MNLLPFSRRPYPVKSFDEIIRTIPENIIPLHSPESQPKPTSPPTKAELIRRGLLALADLHHFMGHRQTKCVAEMIRTSEERQFFVEKMEELVAQIKAMPHTYQQDGLGEQAIAHLHYFTGGCDWWITEKDMGDTEDPAPNLQHQAFGYVDLGHGGELGYISLPEILNAHAELDFHWDPTSLAEIKAKRNG